MAVLKNINLIKAKTNLPSELAAVEAYGKKASTIALTVFIAVGLLAGGIFLYLRTSANGLEATRQTLTLAISQSTIKEGLLSAIKARARAVDSIAATRKPVGPIFDAVVASAPLTQLSSVSLTDERVVMAIHAATIEDVLGVSDAMVRQSIEKMIKDPQIMSLAISRDGTIEVTFSFVAIL